MQKGPKEMTKVTEIRGYQKQPHWKIDYVNANKGEEEIILRGLDDLKGHEEVNQRWLSIARTKFEEAYMALNRAILQPKRVNLDADRQEK